LVLAGFFEAQIEEIGPPASRLLGAEYAAVEHPSRLLLGLKLGSAHKPVAEMHPPVNKGDGTHHAVAVEGMAVALGSRLQLARPVAKEGSLQPFGDPPLDFRRPIVILLA
jgi:hypothetical protein